MEKNKHLLTKEVQQGRTTQKGPSWPRGSNLGDSTCHWITAETSGLRYWIKKYFHCGTKTLPVRQPATLTKPVFILFAIFNRQQYNKKTNKQPKPFQTFNHKWSYSLSMLLFHQGFLLFLADACSNGGVKQLLGRIRDLGGVGWLRWVFIYPSKKKKSMPLCCRRSVWINERFQKAPVKNQCPLHTIDGSLAIEERNDREHLFIVKNYSARSLL